MDGPASHKMSVITDALFSRAISLARLKGLMRSLLYYESIALATFQKKHIVIIYCQLFLPLDKGTRSHIFFARAPVRRDEDDGGEYGVER